MKEFWNQRYKEEAYAYGTEPNDFFKASIEKYQLKGSFLFAAEGEGRNAVYAAKLGNTCTAFDISAEGKRKAEQLAEKSKVKMKYEIASFDEFKSFELFDVVTLCFAHLPSDQLKRSYLKMARFVKPDGVLIIEGFSKEHLQHQKENENAGGPKDVAMLFEQDHLIDLFNGFETLEANTTATVLSEGAFHQGTASVCRIVLKKVK